MQNLHSMPTPGVESRWQIIHIFKPLNNIRGVARELDIPRSVVQGVGQEVSADKVV